MLQSREVWKAAAEKRLPPEERIVERNRAITAHYAGLYLANRDRFKWAGMAAFASNQVGIALAVAELLLSPTRLLEGQDRKDDAALPNLTDILGEATTALLSLPISLYDSAMRPLLLNDLETLRRGNNAIYEDIAWAHDAYSRGGLDELAASLESCERECIFEGFRMIDAGVSKLGAGKEQEGREAIREGNRLLLRQEQKNTLKPIFDAISQQGQLLVSFGSELHFGQAAPPGAVARASFADHFGYLALLTGWKSVTRFEDRWQWIEENVLPAWYRVDDAFPDWPGGESRFRELAGK